MLFVALSVIGIANATAATGKNLLAIAVLVITPDPVAAAKVDVTDNVT